MSAAFSPTRFACFSARVIAYVFSIHCVSCSTALCSTLLTTEALSHHALTSSARSAVSTVRKTSPTRAKTAGSTSSSRARAGAAARGEFRSEVRTPAEAELG